MDVFQQITTISLTHLQFPSPPEIDIFFVFPDQRGPPHVIHRRNLNKKTSRNNPSNDHCENDPDEKAKEIAGEEPSMSIAVEIN